jgi:hypothetical protein
MSGIVAAAAATAASVGMGAYELSQQNSLQGQALSMAQTTQGEQQYYNQLLQQLIANPSSVSQLPGYQFQLSQGSAAVADQMAASGFAGSGNEAAALTQFGQGLASSFYGQQTSLLASLSGVTAPSSPAQNVGAATGAAGLTTNTLSSLLNSLGFYSRLSTSPSGAPAGTPAASPGSYNYGPGSVGTTTYFGDTEPGTTTYFGGPG